jgi:hypothetical protein
MNRKIVRKLFWDFEHEERWLNEYAKEGWSLVSYTWATYTFEPTEPGAWVYRIELLPETEKTPASQEYLRFMDDAGIETVATYMRWVYFRKRADGTPFEIYSDLDSRIAHYQRVLTLFGSLTAALLPIGSVNIINLTHAGRALPFILPLFVLYIAIETLFVTQTVQLAKRVRALKAQKQLFE